MPAYTSDDLFVNAAVTLYFERGHPLTSDPCVTVCTECLFEVWFDEAPTDPEDSEGIYRHYRTGCRDTRWGDFLSSAAYKRALEIMIEEIQGEHLREARGVA